MRRLSRTIMATVSPRLVLPLFARRQMRRGELEMRHLHTLVDRTRASVDAGANLGVYSYWLSKLTPAVHAFEPHPEMARFVRRARLKNVALHELALSDHDGEATLTVPTLGGAQPSPGHSTLMSGNNEADLKLTVQVRRLDGVIGDQDVGFMKVDVEGHELKVLTGAKALISRSRPVLLVEIEPANYPNRSVRDVIREIEEMGYKASYATRDGLRPAGEAPIKAHWEATGHTSNFIFHPAGL
jgi:FkbM family methyltransferase